MKRFNRVRPTSGGVDVGATGCAAGISGPVDPLIYVRTG